MVSDRKTHGFCKAGSRKRFRLVFLYRVCDTAGVSFSYRQDVSSTVIRFERPGAQATVAEDGADAEPKTPAVADADAAWGASLGKLGKSKRKAMELAAANGTVSTGALVERAQITTGQGRPTHRR